LERDAGLLCFLAERRNRPAPPGAGQLVLPIDPPVGRHRAVDREAPAPLDHDGDGHADGQEVVLEPFPLLVSHPVHEEAVVQVDGEDGAHHHAEDAEGGHAAQEAGDQADRAEEFGDHHQQDDHRRQAHRGHPLQGRRESAAAEPAEQLLGAVGEHDQPQEDPHDQHPGVVVRLHQLPQHR